nr:MAG TPA: hyaluronidase [Caudoviricetes sp.]
MAEKILKTRIQLRYDTLVNWTTNDPVLKAGEIAIATIPTADPANKQLPPVMFKVGDGTSKFSELKWASGLAADVYDWAKASTRPAYKYGDADLTGFGTAATKNVSAFDAAGAASTAETNAKAYTDQKIGDLPSQAEYTLETGATDGSLVLKKDGAVVGDPAVVKGWAALLTKAQKGVDDAATAQAAAEAAQNTANAKYTKPTDGIPKTDLASAVQTSLGKADTALQSHQTVELDSGTKNGTLKLTVGGTATDNIAVKGLGSAAYTASTAYATAAQGEKADNALPSATFDSFKTTNTAAINAAKKAGDDAQSALDSYKTTNDAAVSKNATDISNLQTAVKAGITFKGKVDTLPAVTNYENGDLIIVGTKEYILSDDAGTKTWIELGDEGSHLTKATADEYYVAKNTAITGATKCKITYDSKGLVTKGENLEATDIPNLAASKITSGTFADDRIASASTWNAKQNALSADQLKAVNSGITADKVETYDGYATTIAGKQDKLSPTQLNAVNSGITADKVEAYDGYADTISGKQDALNPTQMNAVNSGITSTLVTKYNGYEATISGKQDKITSSNKLAASLVSGLATVATSGSYNDLTDKPTIPTMPTVHDAALKDTSGQVIFTADASEDVTITVINCGTSADIW